MKKFRKCKRWWWVYQRVLLRRNSEAMQDFFLLAVAAGWPTGNCLCRDSRECPAVPARPALCTRLSVIGVPRQTCDWGFKTRYGHLDASATAKRLPTNYSSDIIHLLITPLMASSSALSRCCRADLQKLFKIFFGFSLEAVCDDIRIVEAWATCDQSLLGHCLEMTGWAGTYRYIM
jgi:hypothetical protein